MRKVFCDHCGKQLGEDQIEESEVFIEFSEKAKEMDMHVDLCPKDRKEFCELAEEFTNQK